MNCQSCGMPLDKPEDHGGGDVNNPFCKYCTDERGKLLPKDQVRAKMVQFYIEKQKKTQEEAEKLTDQLMEAMPAWKDEGVGAAAPAEPATPPPVEEPSGGPPSTDEPATPVTPAEPITPEPEEKPEPAEPGVGPEPAPEPTTPKPEEAPQALPTEEKSESPTE